MTTAPLRHAPTRTTPDPAAPPGAAPVPAQAVPARTSPAKTGYGDVLASFGRALSDPTRARVLLALRDGPAYPADLAETLRVSRTNLSNHLACLRGCGLVVAAPEGRRSRYELADPRLAHTLDALAELAGVTGGQEGHGPTGDLALPTGDPSVCPDAPTKGCC